MYRIYLTADVPTSYQETIDTAEEMTEEFETLNSALAWLIRHVNEDEVVMHYFTLVDTTECIILAQ